MITYKIQLVKSVKKSEIDTRRSPIICLSHWRWRLLAVGVPSRTFFKEEGRRPSEILTPTWVISDAEVVSSLVASKDIHEENGES